MIKFINIDFCHTSDTQISENNSGNNYNLSSAILCKTYEQVDAIYNNLKDKTEVFKLTENSNELKTGVVIAEVACVKGLEFDNVYISLLIVLIIIRNWIERFYMLHVQEPSID